MSNFDDIPIPDWVDQGELARFMEAVEPFSRREEVVNTFGMPDSRQRLGEMEGWFYPSPVGKLFYSVAFEEGRVIGVAVFGPRENDRFVAADFSLE